MAAAAKPFGLRAPCTSCPFRTDLPVSLRPGRAREIHRSIASGQQFPCHKTVDYSGETPSDLHATACAGALIISEREGHSSQMTRIAERLGMYDREKLHQDAPVFGTFREWITAMDRKTREEAPGDHEPEPGESFCEIVYSSECENPPGHLINGRPVDNPDGPLCTAECRECGRAMCGECSEYAGPHAGLCLDCESIEGEV